MPPKPAEPDMSTYSGRLAARLRELREQSGLTADELAEKVSKLGFALTRQGYYHWEAGRRQPNWDAVPALAKALNTTPHQLLPEK